MIPIDTEYDSATPEPGYEGLTIAELFSLIEEQHAEMEYYREQEYQQMMHEEMLYANERYDDWDYRGEDWQRF